MNIVFRFHYDVLNRFFFIHRIKIFTFRHLLWLLFHTVQPYEIMIVIYDLIMIEMLILTIFMMIMRVIMIMMVMIMRVMMMTMMTNILSCHPAVSQIWPPVRQLPKGRTYHQTIKNFLITQNSRLNYFRISLAKKTPPWKFQGTGQLRVDLKTPKKRTLEHQREPQTLCFHWSNYETIKIIPI